MTSFIQYGNSLYLDSKQGKLAFCRTLRLSVAAGSITTALTVHCPGNEELLPFHRAGIDGFALRLLAVLKSGYVRSVVALYRRNPKAQRI